MSDLLRGVCLLAILSTVGCAGPEGMTDRSLALQQTATIESLQSEILRLNQELDGIADSRKNLQEVIPQLEKKFENEWAADNVRVFEDDRGLVLSVLDRALFDPEENGLSSQGENILKRVAAVLSNDFTRHRVSLEGHTDNEPVEGQEGFTNWEYSLGRSSAVLHYFLDVEGLQPERFSVTGYSEYHPAASNDTEEGRQLNRRVEIVIMPQTIATGS